MIDRNQFWNRIFEVFKNFNQHTDDYLGAMYIAIFDLLPQSYRLYFNNDKELVYIPCTEPFEDHRKNYKYKLDMRQTFHNMYNDNNFFDWEQCKIFCYSANEYLVLYHDSNCSFLINFTMSESNDSSQLYEEIFTNDIERAHKIIKKYFVIAEKSSKIEFGIAAIDATNCVFTSWYDYKNHNVDVEANYNDDMPYEKMCNILENDDSALMLFYGEPGTGKSSLIKHFISKYEDKDFIFMDGELLVNASKEKLMAYFLECQDTIFILEDCEKALLNRERNYNPVMSILLNLTDGIIGDVLNIKLICTFNTSLSNIDKALLRKGRLSLKYEFKKLAKEKCRKLTNDESINEDMSLADLYHKDDENDYSKQNSRKIGF